MITIILFILYFVLNFEVMQFQMFFTVPPTITQHPSSVIINEMGSTSLSCDATSNVPSVTVTFTWEKFDNTTNTWGPATDVSSGSGTMMISFYSIQQHPEGVYRCTASNSAGNTSSNPATVTVYGEL